MRYQVGEVYPDPTGLVMTLLSILFLGFFLGMRHATDSDHVVAVTTIVSRQRQIGTAAMTGIFWGIGHSITLLVVGGAIILFCRHWELRVKGKAWRVKADYWKPFTLYPLYGY